MLEFIKLIIISSMLWTIALGTILIPISIFSYTQRYVQVNETSATSGLFFTKTIELKEFKKVGIGSGLFGKYDSYSRSDRHEAISVYKD